MNNSVSQAQGFAFGTSPHGLSADLSQTDQETRGAESGCPSAKPVLTAPEVYRSPQVLASQGSLAAAAAGRPRKLHAFEFTESEFLHAYFAVEHDRNKTRKAMKKGMASFEDLKATDSLWRKLQTVMFDRLPRGKA